MRFKHLILCSWRGHKFTRPVRVGNEIVKAPLFACDCCGMFNPAIAIPRKDMIDKMLADRPGKTTVDIENWENRPHSTQRREPLPIDTKII